MNPYDAHFGKLYWTFMNDEKSFLVNVILLIKASKQGSVPTEQLQWYMKTKHADLYDVVIQDPRGWTKFLRKYAAVFKTIPNLRPIFVLTT